MNKRILIIVFVLVTAYVFYSLSAKKTDSISPNYEADQSVVESSPSAHSVDKKASFVIFTHGTFRIFTDPKYHNQSEDVFIEAQNPNIVKVKKDGITWNVFFKTLPFSLTHECLVTGTKQTFCSGANGVLKFYRNGELVQDLLNQKIQQNDQVLVSFGNENEFEIQKQLERVVQVAKEYEK